MKDFKDQAKKFITPQREAKKIKPTEIKERRVQLLLRPSLYEAIENKRWEMRMSLNELAHQAFEEFLERHK
ncbi:MAG: hypothetical protein PHT77_12060 [Bacteroidales bacterium]|nr:hypothetical protein [Bacteroidales bacterium]